MMPLNEDASVAPAPKGQPGIVLKGRTIPRKGEEVVVLADVITASGAMVRVNLFLDDLRRIGSDVPVSIKPARAGETAPQNVPIEIRPGRKSDFGDIDLVSKLDGRSVVDKLPEFVRDVPGRRWLRPHAR